MTPKIKRAIRKVKSSRIDFARTIVSPDLSKEGHHVPSNILAKCHRRASLGPNQEKFEIRKANLKKLRDKYAILDDIRMTVLGPDDRILSPLSDALPSMKTHSILEFGSLFIHLLRMS